MTASKPDLAVHRPFRWGILILADVATTGRWPELKPGAAFAATPACIVAVVRHAQDTDLDPTLAPSDIVPPFEVSLNCWVNQQPTTETTFNGVLKLASHSLQIGDAERWDTITLPSAAWHVQIATNQPKHPDHVNIWLNTITEPPPADAVKPNEQRTGQPNHVPHMPHTPHPS